MQKLVLDSDAYIKLYKSGALGEICNSFKCLMTNEVYGETVTSGLKNFREEAKEFERMIVEKRITLVGEMGGGPEEHSMGKGETSVLLACQKLNCIAVSDDRRFLSLLESRIIPYHTPASLIVEMHENKLMDRKTALASLEKLRPFSNKEVIGRALKEIGGE